MKAVQISLLVIIALALWMIAFNTLVDTNREPAVQHLEDGKTFQKKGDVTELTDGNFIYRDHKTEPVHFEETIEYNEDGMLESWGTNTPYNDSLFGRYRLSVDDKDANGDMDQLSLSLNGSKDGRPYIVTFFKDTDNDKFPDSFTYMVTSHDKKISTMLDLNLDGQFDYKTGNPMSQIRLATGWKELADIKVGLNEAEPRVVLAETNKEYTFRDGEWIEGQ